MTGGLTEFSGPFSVPVDILTGPDGNLWVLNQGAGDDGSLVVVAPDRTVKATYVIPTPDAGASALAVGPDGNVWFTEQNANKIGKVTPDGRFTEYAVPGSTIDLGDGSGPTDVSAGPSDIVAGPDGALWFTEMSAGKIGRITTDGQITEIATPGSQPTSLAVGSDHLVWFTDTGSPPSAGRVNADGTVSTFAMPEGGSWPIGLTPGPDGALWFVDGMNQAIGRVTTDGTVTETPIRADEASPQRLTFDAAGNLWVTGADAGLLRITPGGVTTPLGPAPAAFGSLAGVAIGPDGAVWFTDTGRDQIGRVDPTTVSPPTTDHTLTLVASAGVPTPALGSLSVQAELATLYDSNPSGSSGDFSVRVDWGDGTTTVGVVRSTGVGTYVVSGGHTYAAAGSYTIAVTVSDTNPAHTPQPNPVSGSTLVDVGDSPVIDLHGPTGHPSNAGGSGAVFQTTGAPGVKSSKPPAVKPAKAPVPRVTKPVVPFVAPLGWFAPMLPLFRANLSPIVCGVWHRPRPVVRAWFPRPVVPRLPHRLMMPIRWPVTFPAVHPGGAFVSPTFWGRIPFRLRGW